MAARRLLIVMLVLLGISTLAAALVPPQRAGESSGSTTESTEEPLTPDRLPRGELLMATIRAAEPERQEVPIMVGDQLLLTVTSRASDQVEIPALGLIETVDRFAPAQFDILAREPGAFKVRLVNARRVVGEISVAPRRPAREGKDGG